MRFSQLTLVVLLLAFQLSSAKADEVDRILTENRNGQDMMQHLVDAKFKNVAVLKGEVQTGGMNGPISMTQGKMGELLATRLENVLILANDDDMPIGVTRRASSVALQRNKQASYATDTGRAELAQGTYPLAWGKQNVAVDVVLVPRLTIDEKAQTVTLSVRYFTTADPKSWKTLFLKEPSRPLSAQVLVDLDRSFAMPKDFFRKRGDGQLRDEFPILLNEEPIKPKEKVPEPVKPETVPPPMPKAVTTGVEMSLKFRVLYNDVEAKEVSPGRVESPKANDVVTMRMSASERLGVVVLVNGVNTAEKDSSNRESIDYLKWILEPGENYIIRGYYSNGEVFPFEVAGKSRAKELLAGLADSDRFGLIELLIYKEVTDSNQADLTQVALRATSQSAKDLASAKEEIRMAMLMAKQSRTRGFLVPGAAEKVKLEETKFQGALAAKRQIRYAE